jgi:hypothetical protein
MKKLSKKDPKATMTYPMVVAWIADNDEPLDLKPSSVRGYISVLLAADIFGVHPRKISKDIVQRRVLRWRKRL